ncbi:MAG TPA: FMN-binding protein [Pirellulaceae bacterium]|nr:FMN-binding protein [Pirellulaceae bacterium]
MAKLRQLIVAMLVALLPGVISAAEIDFLSGNKLECTVLSKDDKSMKVEVVVNGKTIVRTYQLSAVHAVTINSKRHLINEKPSGKTAPGADSASGPANPDRRTKAEIEALIQKVGREPPEWFAATTVNTPASLDMAWPEPVQGGWNNQKNMGQYIWDVINPNPAKWREGVKLMHTLLATHQDNPVKRTRIMMELGRMYHDLHEDYARAAFWWQLAGADRSNPRNAAGLARCYYRLGNKPMAVELLSKQPHTIFSCKLWADMGDMPKAEAVAEAFVSQNVQGVEIALLHVADGYRQAGKPDEAIAWYQRVVDLKPADNNKQRFEKTQTRALASLKATRLFQLADVSKVADGDYNANALGYEGPVHVAVTVKDKRITGVRVTQHKEKQFYAAISDTPAKIIAKQGVKGVDATSNATITSEAIINATSKALASGAK